MRIENLTRLLACRRIQVFDLNGKFVVKYGTEGSGPGELNFPFSTAAFSDGKNGVVRIPWPSYSDF